MEQILPSLSLACWTLLRWKSTYVIAIQLADGLSQRLPNNPRERARTCRRRFDLSADEKSLVLGPLPPQGGLEAAEGDGVDRLLRAHLMEQPDFERSRSVCRLGDVDG